MTAESSPPTTIVGAELDGAVTDVRLEGSRIVAVGTDLPTSGTRRVPADGGALLPGLHDHHLHLLAMAAADRSLDARALPDPAAFDAAVAESARAPGDWLRVVGYDDRHGPLDAARLDRLAPGRKVRVQHGSGAAWMLSTAAVVAVTGPSSAPFRSSGADTAGRGRRTGDDARIDRLDPIGGRARTERRAAGVRSGPDDAGRCPGTDGPDLGGEGADGWWHRADEALGRAWPDDDALDLAAVGTRLAAVGITGVTDATPFTHPGGFERLAAARAEGVLDQRIVVTGGPALAGVVPDPALTPGPVKVVVADHDLPSIEELVAALRAARAAGRTVALHCVTRVALVLALAAWEEAGAMTGDRIEHASVLPVELMATVAELGLRVVTQPGFVWARGDRYLAEVDPDDRPHLYRCGSLMAAGIEVGGSTDAPFGPEDPWLAIRTAIGRRTAGGNQLGGGEAVDGAAALALFLSAPEHPGGPPRRVAVGAPADLCLLDRPLTAALSDPSAERVRATWIAGDCVHTR